MGRRCPARIRVPKGYCSLSRQKADLDAALENLITGKGRAGEGHEGGSLVFACVSDPPTCLPTTESGVGRPEGLYQSNQINDSTGQMSVVGW